MAVDVKGIGEITWVDLTIPGADTVARGFYQSVIGWTVTEFNMGDYNDYVVATSETKETVAGICQARGENASLPPYWIIYIKVASLEASLAACRAQGGAVLTGPRQFGGARFCVLKDPAGAVFGVIEGDAGGG